MGDFIEGLGEISIKSNDLIMGIFIQGFVVSIEELDHVAHNGAFSHKTLLVYGKMVFKVLVEWRVYAFLKDFAVNV